MSAGDQESWGRVRAEAQRCHVPRWADKGAQVFVDDGPYLPRGRGRSYGDSCLVSHGTLIATRALDHFVEFDTETGRLRAQAGVGLDAILALVMPRGWFLPVTPGTKFVSLGGAIANDVHGKNHHVAGTFGRHVRRLSLLRSSGESMICSEGENPELYRASIGGLGLTGLIQWAEIQLKPISTYRIVQEAVPFAGLAELVALSEAADRDWEYTVAWVDCFSRRRRGVFFRGRHLESDAGHETGEIRTEPRISVPMDMPGIVLNRLSMKLFNALYYRAERGRNTTVDFDRFFYPLDAIGHWNRIYGRKGFYQYQCVVPLPEGTEVIERILQLAEERRTGSFLSVVKVFGDIASPGMMSFPRKGLTLALDFPNRGQPTLDMLERFDALVREAGGAVYPAKDARMSRESFVAYYPRWREFAAHIDPAFSSDFWRRVTGVAQ